MGLERKQEWIPVSADTELMMASVVGLPRPSLRRHGEDSQSCPLLW